MAFVDETGAVETYDPPIRVFMDVYGPNDRVAQTLARLLRKVRRGGVGTFCVSLIPKPNEARVRVELLEDDWVSINIMDKDGETERVIGPDGTGEDPDVRVV